MKLNALARLVCGTALLALSASFALAGDAWTITALEGGWASEARDINDRGDIVGNVVTEDFQFRAAIWNRWGGWLLPIVGEYSEVYGINNNGQAVGYAIVEEPQSWNGYAGRAVFWDGGKATLIPTVGGLENFAYGINDNGVVAGHSYATRGSHAFTWSKRGGLVDKGNLDPDYAFAFAGANDINDKGTIVSTAYILFQPFHAAMAAKKDKSIRDISFDGGRFTVSEVLAINDQGVMVGYSSGGKSPEAHAAVFDGQGGFTDLGTLEGMPESVATDVSDTGDIVGYAFGWDENGPVNGAFLYRDGKMVDLMSMLPKGSGWQALYRADGVNNRGQIVGAGLYNGEYRAFVIDTKPYFAKPK